MPRYSFFVIVLSWLLSSASFGQDTLASGIQGTIRIMKPRIQPYLQVNYHYNVLEDKARKGSKEQAIQQVDEKHFNVQKPKVRISPLIVKKMDYQYASKDTPRIDSMRVILLVTRVGKLKKVLLAEKAGEEADEKLSDQFVKLMEGYSEWDKDYKVFEPGGVIRKKSWYRNEKFYPKDFNVEATIIFSSFPQTEDQWKTGRRYDVDE